MIRPLCLGLVLSSAIVLARPSPQTPGGTTKAGSPGSSGTTYSVTGTSYVSLPTAGGQASFVQYQVKSNPAGCGGGAVVSAKACSKDVSKCVSGTVSGGTGVVLVKVSDNGCKHDMQGCSEVCATMRNGDTICVAVPGFLCQAEVQLDSLAATTTPPEIAPNTGTVHAAPTTFRVAALGAVVPGGPGGTSGSLPPQSLAPYTGPVLVHSKWIVTLPGGSETTIPGNTQTVDLVNGEGTFTMDLTGAPSGWLLIFETAGALLDSGTSSYVIE